MVGSDRNRNARLAENAMSVSQIPGLHASKLERHDGFAKQSNKPSNRTNESSAALPGPVHRFRKIDLSDQAGQSRCQHVRGLLTGHMLPEIPVLALGCLYLSKVGDRNALLLCKSGNGA